MPRSIAARVEALEAGRVDRRVPRFWIVPSTHEPLTVQAEGQVFTRQPGEPWETFRARVEACTSAPLIVAAEAEFAAANLVETL